MSHIDTSAASQHHNAVPREEYQRLPKKLIVCCDGTWMDSDNGYVKPGWWKAEPGHMQVPSNVTRISRAIAAEDDQHHPQIVYYQAGIGTGLGLYNHLVGGGTGLGLAEHIREAYAFLVNNYTEHDRITPLNNERLRDSIFLIGFSRGAFTARSLGGFIGAFGILKKLVMPHFYDIFNDWESAGDGQAPKFFDAFFQHHQDMEAHRKRDIEEQLKRYASVRVTDSTPGGQQIRDDYCALYARYMEMLGLTQRVEIKCIGVWDTVGALGIPINPILQRFLTFLPSFVKKYKWFDTRLCNEVKNAFHALALDERRFPYSPAVWELQDGGTTNLKQVWFPGAHSNVGGGYEDPGSANITLAWMMDQLAGNHIPAGDRQATDWIKFDTPLVSRWFDCELDWFEKNKVNDCYKGWGNGKLYDSLTPPQSWAGRKVRTPGLYRPTLYGSGGTDFSRELENTNEMIHSCVRARLDLGGRDVEPDWDQVSIINLRPIVQWLWYFITRREPRTYLPNKRHNAFWPGPLEGWELRDGHASHQQPNWNIDVAPDGIKDVKWVRRDTGKEMTEDKLVQGGFEWMLLEKDKKLATQMAFSNHGQHWMRTPTEGVRRSGTDELT